MNDWAPRVEPGEDPGSLERSLAAAALYIDIEDRLFPRQPTLLERYASGLRLSGAVVLGCLAAAISMFAMHIVLTLILHFQPS